MDFVEIPITVDPDSRMWGGKHLQDLRVELVDAKNHRFTIQKAVDRQGQDDHQGIKYLNILTHNYFDYSNPSDFRRETLEKMIESVRGIVNDAGHRLVRATSEQLANAFRKRYPIDR